MRWTPHSREFRKATVGSVFSYAMILWLNKCNQGCFWCSQMANDGKAFWTPNPRMARFVEDVACYEKGSVALSRVKSLLPNANRRLCCLHSLPAAQAHTCWQWLQLKGPPRLRIQDVVYMALGKRRPGIAPQCDPVTVVWIVIHGAVHSHDVPL